MKKIRFFAMAMTLLIALSVLTACGGKTAAPEVKPSGNQTAEPAPSGEYVPDVITILCAYNAGTGVDMQGRYTFNTMMEEKITPASFVFENYSGGSGQVGFGVALEQRAGDQNLIFCLSSTMAMLNEIQGAQYSYKDMIPIGQVADDFNLVIVPGSSPYQTLDDMIAGSQSKELVGGCSGAAGIGDILINRLKMETDLQARVLPFDGNGNTKTAILGNQVDFAIMNISNCLEHLKNGEMRALAVTASERLTLEEFKDIPTLKELGIDIEQSTFRGFAMLPGTPDEVVAYWEEKLAEVVKTETFQKEYCEVNGLTPNYLNAADFKARLDAEYEIYTDVLTKMGLAK